MSEIIKVCAYCRVSTDSKDQKNSFENQKKMFKDIANEDKGMELVKIYADSGISGTSLNKREAFNQMLFDAGLDIDIFKGKTVLTASKERKPRFQRILVKNSSRIARNMEVITIINELRSVGVYIDFLDLGLTTEKHDDQFIINFFLNFDEQEAKDKSKKIRKGHELGSKKGVIHVNCKIYGYEYISESNELVIIEEEASVIKKIYDLYVNEGLGIRRIINYLDENGITTREGESFCKSTISRILSNHKYCGDLIRNKWDSGIVLEKHSPRIRPEEEWIVHKDVITPIVSKEMFKKAQEIRISKAKNQRGIYKGKSKYVGLIKCAKCGGNYTRNIDNGRAFYNCSLKKSKGTKACNNLNVSMQDIDDLIEKFSNGGIYDSMVHTRDEKIELLKQIKEKMLNQIDADDNEIVQEKKLILNNLNSKKEKLLDLFLDGKFDKKSLDERVEKLNIEIQKLTIEINNLSKTNEVIIDEIKEIDERISELEEMKIKKEYTQDEVLEFINEIVVDYNVPHHFFWLTVEFKVVATINKLIEKYIADLGIPKLTRYVKSLDISKNIKKPPEIPSNLQIKFSNGKQVDLDSIKGLSNEEIFNMNK